MKNSKWVYILLAFSILSCIYSCAFYNTIPLEDSSAAGLKAKANQKQFVTLNKEGSDNYFLLENANWGDETISGNLKRFELLDHPEGKDDFRGGNSKAAGKYLHLETSNDLQQGPISISYDDILGGRTHELEAGTSLLATTGVVAALGIVGAAAFVAIACNCPYVATINSDGSQEFQGSLFPGSIFKSLKRSDHLILKNVHADENGMVNIKVYNELDEVQYIDELKLLQVSHKKPYLGLLNNMQLIAYEDGIQPSSAFDHNGGQILRKVVERDDFTYDYDAPAEDMKLSSTVLTFNTAEVGLNPLLVVQAKQTELLEHTAEVFFRQFGTKFPKWVEKMNDVTSEKYEQNSIDQGIALNVYVKVNSDWQYQGSFSNVGGMAMRNLLLPIKLPSENEAVEVMLESAYGFWSVDQVTLTSDYTTNVEITEHELVSAVNQDGEDVKDRVQSVDDDCLVQRLKGTSTDLKFKSSEEEGVTYVLAGTGYYNHERNYASKANRKFLRKMKNNKYSTHQLAQQVQLYKDTHLASNQ